MSDELRNTIVQFLLESGIDRDELDNEDYIGNDILDSMQIVDIVAQVEDNLHIEIDANDIVPENFKNIGTIEKVVRKYMHITTVGGSRRNRSNLETLWDMAAKNAGNSAIEQSGWFNSFTDKPFSEEEMGEYVADIYSKVNPYINEASSVIEVGIGSGLVAKEIAPKVKEYCGVDISEETLKMTKNNMEKWGIDNVTLIHGDMRQFAELDLGQFDVIMANSCVYYLDNLDEYNAFIYECLSHVSKGIVFIGDVLNADRHEEYKKVLEENGKKEHNKLLWYTADDLRNAIIGISNVTAEVTEKTAWTIPNEMNQFRFDVMYKKDM